jgi:hypothetical protein
MRQSLPVFVASPENLELMPIMAMGSLAPSAEPDVVFILRCGRCYYRSMRLQLEDQSNKNTVCFNMDPKIVNSTRNENRRHRNLVQRR